MLLFQVSLLDKTLSALNVDVKTVDQFQGSDRDIVIYSCTRTAEKPKQDGPAKESILDDERRLNVAVTRAKAKLVIVGNSTALKTYGPFAKMLDYLEQNSMTYTVSQSDFGQCNMLNASIGQEAALS